MNRFLVRLGVVALAVMFAGGVVVYSDVTSSKHNLGSTGTMTDKSTNEDEVCVFCHTPHAANPSVPLWNHTQSAGGWTPYSSSTLQSSPGTPSGISALCLSCHDGSVAVNSLVNPPNDLGGANPTMGSGNELNGAFQIAAGRPTNFGSDLSNDHPVSFVYDATLASSDGSLNTPDSTSWVDAGQTVPLFGGSVECASCHDPHDTTNTPFLVKSNAGSALCKTCHQQ